MRRVQPGVGPGGVCFIWWGEKVGCREAQGTGEEPGELESQPSLGLGCPQCW